MTEKRYTVILGLNNGIEKIIDHCRQDKHICIMEFLKQVNEQDKAFKKLKKENKKLKAVLTELKEGMKYDIEYGIEHYSKTQLEYLVNVLEKLEEGYQNE